MDIVITPFIKSANRKEVLESICELDCRVFGKEHGWKETNFLIELPGKKLLSYIALAGKTIEGYLIGSTYKTLSGNNAHINRIAANPRSLKKGVGRELVWTFEDAAIEIGCESATLEFSSDLNVAGFYEKCGYRALGKEEDILEYVSLKGKEKAAEEYTSFRRRIYIKDLLK
jgi:GNAT superfamily N-acetyltransferase